MRANRFNLFFHFYVAQTNFLDFGILKGRKLYALLYRQYALLTISLITAHEMPTYSWHQPIVSHEYKYHYFKHCSLGTKSLLFNILSQILFTNIILLFHWSKENDSAKKSSCQNPGPDQFTVSYYTKNTYFNIIRINMMNSSYSIRDNP